MSGNVESAAIEIIPFQPPHPELLELFRFLDEMREAFAGLTEFNREELYGFGELTPRQVDKLLT